MLLRLVSACTITGAQPGKLVESGKEKPIIGVSCHCCRFVTDTPFHRFILPVSYLATSHSLGLVLVSIVPIELPYG